MKNRVAFTASAFYYQHAVLAADFAGILHKTEDSLDYAKLAASIKKTIRDTFYHGNGQFANSTPSAQLFGLWQRLTPNPPASFAVLHDSIQSVTGTYLLVYLLRNVV